MKLFSGKLFNRRSIRVFGKNTLCADNNFVLLQHSVNEFELRHFTDIWQYNFVKNKPYLLIQVGNHLAWNYLHVEKAITTVRIGNAECVEVAGVDINITANIIGRFITTIQAVSPETEAIDVNISVFTRYEYMQIVSAVWFSVFKNIFKLLFRGKK
jgi:hypothetical protein